MTDPKLMDLTYETAVITGLFDEEMASIKQTVSERAADWPKAHELATKAAAGNGTAAGEEAMRQLLELLAAGSDDMTKADRAVSMAEKKAKIIKAHGGFLKDQQLMLSLQKLDTFTRRLMTHVNEIFEDMPDRLQKLADIMAEYGVKAGGQ